MTFVTSLSLFSRIVFLALVVCTPLRSARRTYQQASSSIDTKQFANEVLQFHNEYRAKHGSPPLKLNEKISNFSMKWAAKIASENKMNHSKNKDYGENLYCYHGDGFSAKNAVESWYNECQNYPYGNPNFIPGKGHFTQLVWKESSELGVGLAKSSNGTIYVVANYMPPGNFQGNFATNVLPPKQ